MKRGNVIDFLFRNDLMFKNLTLIKWNNSKLFGDC